MEYTADQIQIALRLRALTGKKLSICYARLHRHNWNFSQSASASEETTEGGR